MSALLASGVSPRWQGLAEERRAAGLPPPLAQDRGAHSSPGPARMGSCRNLNVQGLLEMETEASRELCPQDETVAEQELSSHESRILLVAKLSHTGLGLLWTGIAGLQVVAYSDLTILLSCVTLSSSLPWKNCKVCFYDVWVFSDEREIAVQF